jgi:hypothetical protein
MSTATQTAQAGNDFDDGGSTHSKLLADHNYAHLLLNHMLMDVSCLPSSRSGTGTSSNRSDSPAAATAAAAAAALSKLYIQQDGVYIAL